MNNIKKSLLDLNPYSSSWKSTCYPNELLSNAITLYMNLHVVLLIFLSSVIVEKEVSHDDNGSFALQ
jgi:hypothetical protein